MIIKLSHIIVRSQDNNTSTNFLAEILGLDAPTPFGIFLEVCFVSMRFPASLKSALCLQK